METILKHLFNLFFEQNKEKPAQVMEKIGAFSKFYYVHRGNEMLKVYNDRIEVYKKDRDRLKLLYTLTKNQIEVLTVIYSDPLNFSRS